jgi:hypothetical protein
MQLVDAAMIVMVITFAHAKGRIVAIHHTLMMSPLPRVSDYLENSLAVFMPPDVLGVSLPDSGIYWQ